ncbi:MAG TPA: hypothetical protein PLN52_09875 [Opitutaceae bacterium]|nr:hypothetical protein [Opitutaceae bacterium]
MTISPSLPNRLRELVAHERPQERLSRHGPAALSDNELLAMILRNGTRGQDVMTLSTNLIRSAGSLSSLLTWREPDYRRHKGIGRVKALQLLATVELARRMIVPSVELEPVLDHAEGVVQHMAG